MSEKKLAIIKLYQGRPFAGVDMYFNPSNKNLIKLKKIISSPGRKNISSAKNN